LDELLNSKKNIFDNGYILFLLLIIVAVVNIVASVYFLSIMLAGVVFVAYSRCLKTQNYYPMIFVLIAFLIIELNNGFKPFSIILVASFIHVYLIPFLTRIVVIDSLSDFLQITLLYVAMAILWLISNDLNFSLVKILVLNFILDIIIIGFAP
jgi:hypothetical protein